MARIAGRVDDLGAELAVTTHALDRLVQMLPGRPEAPDAEVGTCVDLVEAAMAAFEEEIDLDAHLECSGRRDGKEGLEYAVTPTMKIRYLLRSGWCCRNCRDDGT